MAITISMPLLNVNDDSAILVRWLYPEGAMVNKDEAICIVETTKSAVDLYAEANGILRHLSPTGIAYKTGTVIGFLTQSVEEEVSVLDAVVETTENPTVITPKWTRKAQILAQRFGIDLNLLAAQYPDVSITEELIKQVVAQHQSTPSAEIAIEPSLQHQHSWGITQERILILGGGGGAALVLDILSSIASQTAIGVLDNNSSLVGAKILGTDVLGDFSLVMQLWQEKKFDSLISTVVRDIDDRAAIFERFTQLGIPFANVIAPSVAIRQNVKIGTGNLIVHGGYIATGVHLGNNNFLAAGTYIEHHSVIGNHCTFGPRTSLSGRVTVADRVKFGTQVAVEPFIEIGTKSVVASGVVLTSHVPAHSIVKNTTSVVIRHAR